MSFTQAMLTALNTERVYARQVREWAETMGDVALSGLMSDYLMRLCGAVDGLNARAARRAG